MNNNKQKPVSFFGRVIGKIKKKISEFYSDYEEKRARQDIIFTEKIHAKEEPPEKITYVRGGIDMQFLVLVIALIAFGATMCFSATAQALRMSFIKPLVPSVEAIFSVEE